MVSPEISFRSLAIPAPQTFLNEARLSARARHLFRRPPGRAATLQADTPRLMVLDNVLIGLDQSNRLPVLQALDKHFPDWQIVLLTQFPPVGLPDNQLDKIQRELLAHCQLIKPPYFPVLSLEEVEGRNLIVLWAPAGQNRPYRAPETVTANKKTWNYYIRRNSSTVEAKERGRNGS